MDEKKDGSKNNEFIKLYSKADNLKRNISTLKNPRAKFSMKKVGRSRNQKGHKSY